MPSFAAGPAELPKEVVERIRRELPAFEDSGVSILSLTHRSTHFTNLLNRTLKDLREICLIPNNYEILLLSGGGAGQFDAIPLNLMRLNGDDVKFNADYLVTGLWSEQAAKHASKYGKVKILPGTTNGKYVRFPKRSEYEVSPDSAYLYYCSNETINGVEACDDIDVGMDKVVVADTSSNFGTRPFAISKHGLLFSCVQKNLGVAGLTIVIVRNDLLTYAHPFCPSVLNYHCQRDNNSVYNTPPTFNIYVLSLVLQWMRSEGGLEEMYKRSLVKSSSLYAVIDNSNGFYINPVSVESRSRMNIPFRLKNPDLERTFLSYAKADGLMDLGGHRSVGGLRASLYNGLTVADVQHLTAFMARFQEKYDV
uniref:phosphoserine transaminase n=1 Tax=Trichuris muris TaxID=70415 RepID=A0A5S6QEB5_TRIMR